MKYGTEPPTYSIADLSRVLLVRCNFLLLMMITWVAYPCDNTKWVIERERERKGDAVLLIICGYSAAVIQWGRHQGWLQEGWLRSSALKAFRGSVPRQALRVTGFSHSFNSRELSPGLILDCHLSYKPTWIRTGFWSDNTKPIMHLDCFLVARCDFNRGWG